MYTWFSTPILQSGIVPSLNIEWSSRRVDAIQSMMKLGYRSGKLGKELTTFLEFMTAPATKILDKWFESDILKATLATDAIIGAKVSPSTPGSAYILFHHVMGEVNGVKGMWGHVKGGMGGVSQALEKSAIKAGAEIFTNAPVKSINVHDGRVQGVSLESGDVIDSDFVLSNASPMITMLDLLDEKVLPERVVTHFKKNWNCESASTKIEDAFLDVQHGYASKRPVIEMNVPTSLDPSIAPPGDDGSWDTPGKKEKFADQVFSVVDQFAPGFKNSIIGYDMLTLFWMRPIPGYSDYRSPIQGLYLSSAGSHPGGGVMGACGRNSAMVCLKDMQSNRTIKERLA
ncbi:Pyridine nucleotide-disulfide oxidoreductase domain-containing protein 2, partial [Globisporangium splendens]